MSGGQNYINLEPFPIVTLHENASPIRCPSRFRSEEDHEFIRQEIKTLAEAGVIENSQPLLAGSGSSVENHKTRKCIDYYTTVNRYTVPDAYPIPVIEQLLLKMSSWKWFSYIDLESAYHQLRLSDEEKHLTAFEANGELWQFNRLPFGETNGVPAFQKAINTIVDGLEGIAVDNDDVVIGGASEAEHDKNLAEFRLRAQKYNLTINEEKSNLKVRGLKFLGHRFSDGKIHPGELRMKPLIEFLVPTTLKKPDRFVGMSVYYYKWVGDFANIAAPLLKAKRDKKLPLQTEIINSKQTIKRAVSKAALWIPDRTKPFVLKTDASGNVIGAVLTQNGQPVAFVSHEFSDEELNWSAIEKEAFAIVWSVQKCRRYLFLGKTFLEKLSSNQVSVLNEKVFGFR